MFFKQEQKADERSRKAKKKEAETQSKNKQEILKGSPHPPPAP
jgi:hypothetical protein